MTKTQTPGSRVEAALANYVGPTTAVSDPSRLPIVSPFSPDSDLSRIIWTDLFGDARKNVVNSRSTAMRLPPVARARNLVCGTIGRFPLVVSRKADRLPVQPTWTTATEDGSSPELRIIWTIDDLLFHGWSLWHRKNSTVDGFPLAATHVNRSEWLIDDDNRLCVHGRPVQDSSEWTLIPGLHEGILSFGSDVLATARDLYSIVGERIANNVPPINLEAQPGADRLNGDEVAAIIASWKSARERNGGVGYTNEWVKAVPLAGQKDADLLIDARNAAAVDLARLVGVHAGLVDATAPKASLNYETTSGRNQEFIDLDLALHMLPITARLSLDDFVPHGQRTSFDTADFTGPVPSPTGPATED